VVWLWRPEPRGRSVTATEHAIFTRQLVTDIQQTEQSVSVHELTDLDGLL